jgi:superfamily II DNA or RNA helicase
MRAALPVLTRARTAPDAHPSVGLLAGAVLLGMRLVADGKFEPSPDGPWWQPVELSPADLDRLEQLAAARAHDQLDASMAEGLARRVMAAVVDTMPRTPPTPGATSAAAKQPGAVKPIGARRSVSTRNGERQDFPGRLQERLARLRADGIPIPDDRPNLVNLSLRVEAAEEELVAGGVRLVLQVHDERNPLHLCDAALLWTDPETSGFGGRARTHASLALRAAAEAWPVLDRLQELRVPDEITLDTDELVSLLDTGVGALRAIGIDVLWPRSLGRDLTASTVLEQARPRGSSGRTGPAGQQEEALQDGRFGPDSIFAFNWRISLAGEPLTDDEMDQLAHAAAPVIRLRDQWLIVDPAIAKKAKKRLVRTVSAPQAVAAALTSTLVVEDSTVGVVVGATLERVRSQLRTASTRQPIPVPDGLAATLRDYQRHGLTWLAELTSLGLGACLADDMGLGKTVQVIALHLHRAAVAGGGPTLVVCPTSLLGNWEAEVRRFAPGVPVRRFHGGGRSLSSVTEGFVLTTYGTLRRSAGDLAEVAWDLVVADEAQHVKNAATSTARALRTVPSTARVALTGTPIENELTELWAILDWATPGLLGSRNAFRKAWAQPIESGVDPEVTRRFADLIGPFVLRRKKSDPGIAPELPPKTETDHLVGLTREQTVLYEALVRDSMERIERADPESRRGLILAMLTGLKQICNHPAHYLRQSNPKLGGRSEKFDLLDELLGTILAEEGAVLLFTQYVAMGNLLEAHLARLGIPHLFLHGGSSVAERERMVREFQAGASPVFILSLKAGGTGLNLTRADHVVHVDRWWNPAVEDQATDRAYRIGQTRPVQVHRIIAEGTIEERIAELLAGKRALAEAVMSGGETALTELSNAELRDLVELRRERS